MSRPRVRCKHGHAAYPDHNCECRTCPRFVGEAAGAQHECPWCSWPVYASGRCDNDECANWVEAPQ